MVDVAVDNDVLIKGACFGLLSDLLDAVPCSANDVGVLGAAPYVIRGILKSGRLSTISKIARANFERLLKMVSILEPSPEEIAFAAELEAAAQHASTSLDSGESQLCAILIIRPLSWLLTGDKRAIKALELLVQRLPRVSPLAGKIICLEQLLLRLLAIRDPNEIRRAICAAATDRALVICFSCSNENVQEESWAEGLRSYIADLRRDACTVLCAR